MSEELGTVFFCDPGTLGADAAIAALDEAGFEVRRVADAAEASAALVAVTPEIVLVAIGADAPEGQAVIDLFRSSETYSTVSVIVACGRDDIEARDRALAEGALDALHRPYDPIEIGPRARAALRLAVLNRDMRRFRLLASVGQYALRLDHIVNNPLAGIRGNAELIVRYRGVLPEEIRECAQSIEELAARIGETVGQIARIRESSGAAAERPSDDGAGAGDASESDDDPAAWGVGS